MWAGFCPENFADRQALVSAELARIEARDVDAMQLYDRAARSAHENRFVHTEALALELAGRFYRSRGFERTATTYLRDARACYERWGAGEKVRQLDQQYPEAVDRTALAPMTLFSARVEQLDLLSVVKASQAISGEILLPQLQETLMRLVLEQAGAQRGCLLLDVDELLTVRARAEIGGARTEVTIVAALPASDADLPMTLLNYVRRSGETVVIADARADNQYSGDEYFAGRRPRSVLGLPITRKGRPIGILYLENDLIAGAFVPHQLAVLELLAAQAAISLETARLYAGLQQENVERLRAEQEVRQLNWELEERVRDRTAQLQEKNHALESFAHSVSHDLRAPLRHIDGYLDMLQRRSGASLDEQSLQYMDTIARSARRMARLIDDLLGFSRMSRREMSRLDVDLSELVRDVVRELEPDAASRDACWTIGDLPVVTGDRSMLRVALVNLVSNAVKFTRTREPARIEIGSMRLDDDWVVFVRDNGVGFDPRYGDKLFGVFQRLHPDQEFEGVGIGLANVRQIVRRHGGRTWAEAEVDHGATFYVSLPGPRCSSGRT